MAVPYSGDHPALPPPLAGTVRNLFLTSLAPTTRRQYAQDLLQFQDFCVVVLGLIVWFPASVCAIAGYMCSGSCEPVQFYTHTSTRYCHLYLLSYKMLFDLDVVHIILLYVFCHLFASWHFRINALFTTLLTRLVS